FRAAWSGARRDGCAPPVVAHGAYLINLAAAPGKVRDRSRVGLADELERCRRLGIGGLVVHPGAHGGAGEGEGLRRVAESLDVVFDELDVMARGVSCATPAPRVLL